MTRPHLDALAGLRTRVVAGPAGVVVLRDGVASVVRPGHVPDAGVETVVTRPPRLRPAPTMAVVQVPVEPAAVAARRLPVVPLLLPLLLGVVMAVLSSPLFLLFTLLSPLMALGTWWSDRGQARRTGRVQAAAYAQACEAFTAELAELRADETAARHEAAPEPEVLLHTVPGPRLWERRRADDDFLLLRVGTGSRLPTGYQLSAGAPELLDDVPITMPLREVGVLGLAGPPGRSLARALVGQAVGWHSPRDLSVWLLVDPARVPSEPDWGWWRWLPHAAGSSCPVLVGNTVDSIAARVAELTGLVAARTQAARDVRAQLQARQLAEVLVVLDGAGALRSLAGVPAVLRDGPAVGVYAVCLEESQPLLPEECQAVVSLAGTAVLHRQGQQPVAVRPDLPTAAWAEQLARRLAPLRDGGVDSGAEIPAAARLIDVLQLDPPTAAAVRARAGRTTAAVVGVDADGPVVLDLQRDGPHVLVAGTTGAGKSELLQTLVASLAVANRPDAMTFVLVDYKGGAAFRDCARLPHTVGLVTDLDGHLVERALSSLTAELRAREQLLQQAGAKDIEDFWSGGGSLPRLVIAIDEFASLVEELPDFVRGLVGIAQRGRSLGVHLVLATQRPSGVVSPEIRANTNLRLALRVTDAAESIDVLDASDAAAIPRSVPGRAFARTGHRALLPFQTARVGGRRPGTTDERLEVVELPWSVIGLPLPRARADEPATDATDLHALVEAVRSAWSDAPAARSPWLEPLPSSLTLAGVDRPRPLLLPFGLEDLPAEQRRRTAALDLVRGGHLLVAGAARSGRTTLLRALAGSLAAGTSADDAHLYAIDCGNGALLALEGLPHTGAVVTRGQPDRVDRLIARLGSEVSRRQQLLTASGWADLAEQRACADEPLPYLLLLLDRWEGFTAAFDDLDAGRLPEALLRLVREGLSAGLRVVVTGDRAALLGKLSQAVEDTVVLRLAERTDYALAGLSPRQLPEHVGDGRGFRAGSGIELQVALLTEDPAGTAQTAALGRLVADLPAPSCRPFRIDPLPARVSWAQARALPRETVGVAVGGDELALLGVDLAEHGPGFTIAGPPRSGRSTALVGVASGLLAAGTTVCALAPRPSPLRHLTGVTHVADADRLVGVLNAATGPTAVVVDDAELLVGSPVADVLAQVLRDGRDTGHALIVAGGVEELAGCFRGFAAEVRRSRSGLLLGLTDHLHGELLGVRLPRSAVAPGPIGRGLLVRSGNLSPVQVPV